MSGLRKQASWLLFSNIFAAILQIIQISVLARHLELHELGMLAIVNSILMIAMILQDMGMSSYIIHRQDLSRDEQSTIYWVNFILSILAGGIVLLVAWPLARFYMMDKLTPLVMLSSINFLFLGSLSQYQAHYIKAKRMVSLSQIEMSAKTLSFLFVIYAILYTELRNFGCYYRSHCKCLSQVSFYELFWR